MMALLYILNLLMLLILILIGIAFLTLFERKILGYIQNRKGPNKLLFKGIFQPFSDAMKLLSKEILFFNSDYLIYISSPMIMFFLSMLLWLIYPWMVNNFNNTILFILLILSMNVYPIMFIGWSSNNNYSMLGTMRIIAQMISFEISLFIMFFIIMMLIENYNISQLFKFEKIWFLLLIFPIYLILFINLLIELNRTPFDLIEGESELVSGFNVEYMSSLFTFIFLAEYGSILFTSFILTIMFFNFNVNSLFFMVFYMFHIYLIMMIRSVLPRIRYDQMMNMCWTDFLILSLTYMYYIYLMKEFNLIINN
uniref:NADH-ubiquinone oxidoreductase chain 1 n=1 Tax=Thyreus decorus TaxID=600203 RepID=A0A7U0M7U5_9HYME|nr:NADH dehydrogenase subunit 1 [Thyreus decorus]QQX27985.1 NADH dehydrogenase subunit 1 [Thyreus decorus]